jgi:2-polyprenyl-6-methoxyphenol hydroxylase-like FAD-dependent oxidoreductase
MKKAIVIGGSVGGLLVGNMLLRQGWSVDIYERTTKGLEARGAGIAPQRALLEALEKAGVTVDPRIGIKVTGRTAYDRAGKPTFSHSYEQYTTSWSLIYNKLLEAFPSSQYHLGSPLVGFSQTADHVMAYFEHGSESCDLLVGADGMRSTVRGVLFPDVEPRYTGYIAWRGMINESELDQDFVQRYFSGFSFAFPSGEELICYPVAGVDGSIDVGSRRFNIMWYRAVAPGAALDRFFTGRDGRLHAAGIPPDQIREDLVRSMKDDAIRLLPSDFAEMIQKMEGMFFQAIYDLESYRLAKGRVALIGDAAFVARPHCGAGVSKAAADSASLVSALLGSCDVANALQRYSAERSMAGKAAVLWAAHLGAYFQMGSDGHRRRDYDPDHPPVDPQFVVENTGIELSEAFAK